jgi:hypothetical protein
MIRALLGGTWIVLGSRDSRNQLKGAAGTHEILKLVGWSVAGMAMDLRSLGN